MSIKMGTNNAELREELSKITEPADAPELKAQIEKVAKLALKYPHSISLLQENVPGAPVFNCYQYSFGANVFFKVGIRKVAPGRDFAQFLVDHYLHETEAADVENGDHVFYASSHINHAGKVHEEAVESKWGTGHPLVSWCLRSPRSLRRQRPSFQTHQSARLHTRVP